MGFGLEPIDKPIEVDKEERVFYKGIFYRKEDLTAGVKAGITRKENRLKAAESEIEKKNDTYDREKKNDIRNKIIDIINKNTSLKDYFNILTLDTSEYLFCNKLSNNHKIFLAQNNLEEYKKMVKNKPENVFLHFGDISDYNMLNENFDVIYLDFCCTFKTAINKLNKLITKMNTAKYIGFSFSWRNHKKELDEPHWDLMKKIQEITGLNLVIKIADSYRDRDHCSMATMFFENKTCLSIFENEKDSCIKPYIICKKCGKKYTFDEYKNDDPKLNNYSGWIHKYYCFDCSPKGVYIHKRLKDNEDSLENISRDISIEKEKKYFKGNKELIKKGVKHCYICGEFKPTSEFYSGGKHRKRMSKCKECAKNFNRKSYRKKHPYVKTRNFIIRQKNIELIKQGLKQCSCCEKTKHVVDFPINRSVSSGYCAFCKDCANKHNRINYDKRMKEIKSEQILELNPQPQPEIKPEPIPLIVKDVMEEKRKPNWFKNIMSKMKITIGDK